MNELSHQVHEGGRGFPFLRPIAELGHIGRMSVSAEQEGRRRLVRHPEVRRLHRVCVFHQVQRCTPLGGHTPGEGKDVVADQSIAP